MSNKQGKALYIESNGLPKAPLVLLENPLSVKETLIWSFKKGVLSVPFKRDCPLDASACSTIPSVSLLWSFEMRVRGGLVQVLSSRLQDILAYPNTSQMSVKIIWVVLRWGVTVLVQCTWIRWIERLMSTPLILEFLRPLNASATSSF